MNALQETAWLRWIISQSSGIGRIRNRDDSTGGKRLKMFKHNLTLRIVKLANVILLSIPFALCWYGYYAKYIINPFYNKGNWFVIMLFVVLYVIFARIYDAFLVSINRISEMIYSQSLAAFVSDGVMFIIIWMLMRRFPNIFPGLAALGLQIVFAAVWSTAAHKWYFASFPPKRSVIVYDVREGMDQLINEYGLGKKFDVERIIQVHECLNELNVLDGIDTVFLSGIHSHDRNSILKYCIEHDVRVYVIPRVGDVLMSGAKKVHMFHLPMLRVGRYSPNPEYIFLKRVFDVVVAGTGVIVLSPVMLITTIAIKAYDKGPVFYRQTRLTRNGKQFKILKFRSMCVDAESNGVARLSTGENDPRITPVGRIIRACRVDELPQLFNVLEGSMTIVGPRPERPEIAAQYEEEMPEFRLRLQAKAGLTGYAQVYGKYNMTPYDKLQMDLMYISNPSLLEDLKICFSTVKILIMAESTEGVEVGATTAMKKHDSAETADEQHETLV